MVARLARDATLVAHADLSFSTGIVALGILALGSTLRRWRRAKAVGIAVTPRWVWGLSAGVIVALWSPILIDAAINDGGNLAELWAAAGADVPVAGPGRSLYGAWYVVSGDWIQQEVLGPALVVVLSALVVTGCTAPVRNRSRSHALLVATALTGVIGVLVGQAVTPAAAGVQPLYLLHLDAVAAFAFFAMGVVGAAGLRRAGARHTASPAKGRGGRGGRRIGRPRRWIGPDHEGSGPETWYLGWSFDSIAPLSEQLSTVGWQMNQCGGSRWVVPTPRRSLMAWPFRCSAPEWIYG